MLVYFRKIKYFCERYNSDSLMEGEYSKVMSTKNEM